MCKKSRKHKICTNICDVSASELTFSLTRVKSAQHKKFKLSFSSLTRQEHQPGDSSNSAHSKWRCSRHCCDRDLPVWLYVSLLLEMRLVLLCSVCAFALFHRFSHLFKLSLSCYVSFSAAAAAWPGLTLLAVRRRVFVSFLVCAARRQSGYILSVFKELFCFKFFHYSVLSFAHISMHTYV